MFIAFLRRLAGFFFILLSTHALAQQYHFIYLQTDNEQPFYVKLNNKILSSSPAGYLILPKMTDGDYHLTVGFPKNEFPEQNFNIAVDNSDEGYLVKNFGDKGWGLFNLQTFGVTMSANAASTQAGDTATKVYSNDLFSKMLANVVKDSTILEKQESPRMVEVPGVSKTDSSIGNGKVDSMSTLSANNSLNPIKESADTLANVVTHLDSVEAEHLDTLPVAMSNTSINYFVPPYKVFSDKSGDGVTMMYVDTFSNSRDTVLIFIPADTGNISSIAQNKVSDTTNNIAQKNISQPQVDSSRKVPAEKDTVVVEDSTSSTPPLLTIKNYTPPVVDTIKSKQEPQIVSGNDAGNQAQVSVVETGKNNNNKEIPEVITSSTTNSDCKAFADNNDFLKLRKRMASESSDENMIKVAKKYFKSKCFSTEQIKNLSFLFLTNQGKYEFFDAAFAFASDSEKYYTLESQLTDTYYLNRFKAMVQR